MENTTQGKVAGRWLQLDAKRSSHIERCRRCAKLTIPSLLPDKDKKGNDPLPLPYQSLGARAVNNLAAKLLLALFPPNTSFFRHDPDPIAIEELKQMDPDNEGIQQEVETQLRKHEQMSLQDFEAMAMRTRLFQGLRLLVATGNTCIELKDDGILKTYRLDKYVVRRAPTGQVKEAIIEEKMDVDDIPDSVKENPMARIPKENSEELDVSLYTHIKLVKNRWEVSQEVCGVEVPESFTHYPKKKLPYLFLTWTRMDGENYGRGHVEEHLGDLNAYDSLSQSLLEGAEAAAFLLLLLHPNATTSLDDIKRARNGEVVIGREEDIDVLKIEKLNDFRIAYEKANDLEENIKRSFLLNESIQRQAERVTAEEVRYMAQELESSLGGIYSVLGAEFQRPFVDLLIANQVKRNKLPALPDEVTTTIITGFDAIGRGHDLQKLREFRDEVVNMAQASGQRDIVTLYIGLSNFFKRVAIALGLETDGLVPDEEEIQQLQQQQQIYEQMMQMMNSKPAGELTKAAVQGGGGGQQ